MDNNVILRAKNLCVSYKEVDVIEHIDLEIEKGKIYSIIGPNGSGKTTLIRALSRNLKPKTGQVLLEDVNVIRMNSRQVARKMAVLGQNNHTMSDVTVKNLVQYGRYAHKEWWKGSDSADNKIVDWAIEKTGLMNMQNRRINTLSGGERQRAWLAMSLAQKPQILLLDEPTTYLDISHQLEILELVLRLNKEEGITIVMVLHDINHAARYSDELIVVKDRKIFKKGDPWTILESKVLREVFGVETEITLDKETNKPVFYARKVV